MKTPLWISDKLPYMQAKQEKLRKTFDIDPQLYDQIRPTYPNVLFEKLIDITRLSEGANLLEIGLGTGQATVPLASRSYNIVTIDIGSNMAAFAQKKLSSFKNVQVLHTSFEDVDLPDKSLDLIYAATAFHWIDPDVKYTKSHDLLKESGYLAIINTRHVSDERGDEFFLATQPLYEKFQPSKNNEGYRLPKESELSSEAFDESLFTPVAFEKFPIQVNYDSESYCRLLSTFSDVINLPNETRRAFLDEMANLIRSQFKDQITKHLVMTLSVAKKI